MSRGRGREKGSPSLALGAEGVGAGCGLAGNPKIAQQRRMTRSPGFPTSQGEVVDESASQRKAAAVGSETQVQVQGHSGSDSPQARLSLRMHWV